MPKAGSARKSEGLRWLRENQDLGYQVSEFEVIGAEVYDAAVGKGREKDLVPLESRLEEILEIFRGKHVSVRSSAMHSEDRKEFSGAGLYETVFVKEADREKLENAVWTVYDSLNGPKAAKERKRQGIADESMEAIVHEVPRGAFLHGVAMSRLPAVEGIIPISWSIGIGDVVKGKVESISTIFLTKKRCLERVFTNENARDSHYADSIENRVGNLVPNLRERYGQEFQIEFSIGCVGSDQENVLILNQIRPLTNISDKKIAFPKKEPILTAQLCMGAGEYVGPWATPFGGTNRIYEGWNELDHYALVCFNLGKTDARIWNAEVDLDSLTPHKRAIVMNEGNICSHAMTIANERGILCLIGMGEEKNKEEINDLSAKMNYLSSFMSGNNPLQMTHPWFDVALQEVGEYIHVVSDGLKAFVYRATREEAEEFEKRMMAEIRYDLDPIVDPWVGNKRFKGIWDWEFAARPSVNFVLENMCRDFVDFIRMKAGAGIEIEVSPAGNRYTFRHRKAEYEVYDAFFDPAKKEEGVRFATGRSAPNMADRATTKAWFNEFARIIKTPGYVPGRLRQD